MIKFDLHQLLNRAGSGDSQATQELLTHFRQRLRRMIVAYLNPQLSARLDPSDVLQDALASVAQRRTGTLNRWTLKIEY